LHAMQSKLGTPSWPLFLAAALGRYVRLERLRARHAARPAALAVLSVIIMAPVTSADGPVAVTGASGYIGSHVVKNLIEHGCECARIGIESPHEEVATAPFTRRRLRLCCRLRCLCGVTPI
jgi:hypothetical protein